MFGIIFCLFYCLIAPVKFPVWVLYSCESFDELWQISRRWVTGLHVSLNCTGVICFHTFFIIYLSMLKLATSHKINLPQRFEFIRERLKIQILWHFFFRNHDCVFEIVLLISTQYKYCNMSTLLLQNKTYLCKTLFIPA